MSELVFVCARGFPLAGHPTPPDLCDHVAPRNTRKAMRGITHSDWDGARFLFVARRQARSFYALVRHQRRGEIGASSQRLVRLSIQLLAPGSGLRTGPGPEIDRAPPWT